MSEPAEAETWTTAEAAAAVGMRQGAFRTLAARARSEGVDLRAPAERWPDARTPAYDSAAVLAYVPARPGRGRKRPDRSVPNGG